MNAESSVQRPTPRWRRRLQVVRRRSNLSRFVEIGTVVALVAMLVVSYLILTDDERARSLLKPPLVAALLVANLVPAMALMVLAARRMAMRRAASSPVGGRGRLHVRLVALFSAIASVPTLLVVIFASFLFQSGTDFWFSDRARGMLENAATIAKQSYDQEVQRVNKETTTMANDLAGYLADIPIDNPAFAEGFFRQVLLRNLSEAVIMNVTAGNEISSLALVNPYDRPLERVVTPQILAELRAGNASVVIPSDDRIGAVVPLPIGEDNYLYAARVFDPQMATQLRRAEAVLADYDALINRSRVLQFRFNAALLLISLLIVALAIWIALALADRLVRPVGELVAAARKVTAGDLSARVPGTEVQDEVATLGTAFNRMTERLEAQTGALVAANQQLESRRALIEAVLSGVSAGIISIDRDRKVQLINRPAEALLKTANNDAVGKELERLAPELDAQLDGDEREDIIQFSSGGEPRTLAVKRVRVEGGHVLTFDDITDQLLDQRRAAWSDVARRIAHEIKNPLTPIQLAAERLQRRYGREITSDASTFERLTGTIVRQVGDLRRMVDEFSSFARMPKPVFGEEDVVDLVRQAMFLHEVAHPDIQFTLRAPDPSPHLVCDRRQIGQALTNILKNGVEAIQQRREDGVERSEPDRVEVEIVEQAGQITIELRDTGVGLPSDRKRLTEPYITTRAKGTGLGLAIVKKIVEEHFGSIEFDSGPAGETVVRLVFDANTLARLGNMHPDAEQQDVVNG